MAWTCPSSTSAQPDRVFGSGYRGGDGVCYIVVSKGKRNGWVMDISQHKSEHEALFMGDSVFRVRGTAINNTPGGHGTGGHHRFLIIEEMGDGEVPPEKQAAPPQLDAAEVWGAFGRDAQRAGMQRGSTDVSGNGIEDLLEEAEAYN